MFKANESKLDRIIRVVVGLVLLAVALMYTTGVLRTVLLVIAVIALVTAATGFCALYRLFGFSTLKQAKPMEKPVSMPPTAPPSVPPSKPPMA